MTNSIVISENFKREVKPLAKKYKTLKSSVDKLISELIENPYLGVSYVADLYKVRLSDKSKEAGKVVALE